MVDLEGLITGRLVIVDAGLELRSKEGSNALLNRSETPMTARRVRPDPLIARKVRIV